MSIPDSSFLPDAGLEQAIALLRQSPVAWSALPQALPENGMGENATLAQLAPHVFGKAAHLDDPTAIAHMDPPTPWITWAMALWNASLNQNLLHAATSPFATEAERLVIDWLIPFFGMSGGHLCSGSTLANLTALWAARDARGVKKIVASEVAHLSIKKAARLLGLEFVAIPVTPSGQLDPVQLGDLTHACLVLTAGTTATGVIDSLALVGQAAWTHVDAAWAGPLRFSPTYTHLLNGIEAADSVSISGHKWLFQPKESALVLFRDVAAANGAISFSGGYLASPNIGVQGSRGAAAIPLLATLLAWGKTGLVDRIDRTMAMAQQLANNIQAEDSLTLWAMPTTGITVFRSQQQTADDIFAALPTGMLSTCVLQDEMWLRSVMANPMADIDAIWAHIQRVISA
ncbi:aminotransferase class V-fold PLP-dependent enzyme [Nodosilinea sp. LEGE 07088]|uniref:pyridoxal phosphate-dependent decarboxylase family protein n=1 Tax=Nodosilinea sp. LEGE 07088 TaxID=2777968 RepID=UPI00187E75EB|nr:pyridoxal-dependent decarboxylase [Nodosilinea sp. LEGE 07088]MBE9138964.1 aminotransferase class V-fold PLP-dependent enzyme [Nodosilinea sp. LEGE 07088]